MKIRKVMVCMMVLTMVCMMGGIANSNSFNIPTADIDVDGNTHDWVGINPVAISPVGCSERSCISGADVRSLWLAKNGNILYFLFKTQDGIDTTGEVGYRLWFDNNRNGQIDNDPEDRQVSASYYGVWCQTMTPQIIDANGFAVVNGRFIEGSVNASLLDISDIFRLESGTHSELELSHVNYDRFPVIEEVVGNFYGFYETFICAAGDFTKNEGDIGGECVAYVRLETDIEIYGHAHTWFKTAKKENYATGNVPEVSSIIVFNKVPNTELRYGHVGIVTSVNGDQVTIRDSNWVKTNIIGEHTEDLNNYDILGFIYCDGL